MVMMILLLLLWGRVRHVHVHVELWLRRPIIAIERVSLMLRENFVAIERIARILRAVLANAAERISRAATATERLVCLLFFLLRWRSCVEWGGRRRRRRVLGGALDVEGRQVLTERADPLGVG